MVGKLGEGKFKREGGGRAAEQRSGLLEYTIQDSQFEITLDTS